MSGNKKRKYRGLDVSEETHKGLFTLLTKHNGVGRIFVKRNINSAKLIREIVEYLLANQEGWVSFSAIKDYLGQNFYPITGDFEEWLQDGNHVRALKASNHLEWRMNRNRYLNFRYIGGTHKDKQVQQIKANYPKGMVEFASYLPVLIMNQGFKSEDIAHSILSHEDIYEKGEWIGGVYVAMKAAQGDLEQHPTASYQPLILAYLECITDIYQKVVNQAIQEG